MAKLEVDNTNVEFLNCSQLPDAVRTATNRIAAKGKGRESMGKAISLRLAGFLPRVGGALR